jgi:hypothetical protein
MKFNNVKIIIVRSLLNEILLIAGWPISHPKFEGKGQLTCSDPPKNEPEIPIKPCWVHFYARQPTDVVNSHLSNGIKDYRR